MAIAACLLVACMSPAARGHRIEFFPGPVDERLQSASYDAVVRVLRHEHATIVAATPPGHVRAFVTIECAGRTLVADLRFVRSAGDQSVAVRVCRAETPGAGPCGEGAAEVPDGECREHTDQLLSSIERDLADHLLGKVSIATADRRRWWDDVSLGSVLSLVSVRTWAAPDREGWWRATAYSSMLAAGPLRSGQRVAALQAARPAQSGIARTRAVALGTSPRDAAR